MSGIEILGTGMYAPEFTVANRDFESLVDTSDEWITARTGMARRHISLGEHAWQMGAKAARNALQAAGVAAGEVDMIVLSTSSGEFTFPPLASLIQREIGADNAFALDISVACAGLTYTLDMARRYLCTGDVRTVLVVGAENMTQHLDYTDRNSCILFADGAGACVVRGSDNPFSSYLHTEHSGVEAAYNKRKRRTLPFPGIPEGGQEDKFPLPVEGFAFMNGREIYKFAVKAIPQALEAACAKLGMGIRDLDLIIPHQANLRIIEAAAKQMGIPMDKICVNIQEYGNTSSASILICLDECVRSGRLRRGDKVGIVGFGAGLTLGADVFVY